MTTDLHGIARLGGVTSVAEPAAATTAGAGGFVTTVRPAKEIAPFDTVVKRAAAEHATRASHAVAAAPPSMPLSAPATDPSAKATKAQKSFEAFALQTFIGSMLPKKNSKLFGTGSAGKMWQSILAEKLADQITASGRLKLLPDPPSAVAAADTGTPHAIERATGTPHPINGTPIAIESQHKLHALGGTSPGLQAGLNRTDGAGAITPAALQDLVGSLRPDRSGGTR